VLSVLLRDSVGVSVPFSQTKCEGLDIEQTDHHSGSVLTESFPFLVLDSMILDSDSESALIEFFPFLVLDSAYLYIECIVRLNGSSPPVAEALNPSSGVLACWGIFLFGGVYQTIVVACRDLSFCFPFVIHPSTRRPCLSLWYEQVAIDGAPSISFHSMPELRSLSAMTSPA
jgi:hypothetical protein